jgi:hypothetical protein
MNTGNHIVVNIKSLTSNGNTKAKINLPASKESGFSRSSITIDATWHLSDKYKV